MLPMIGKRRRRKFQSLEVCEESRRSCRRFDLADDPEARNQQMDDKVREKIKDGAAGKNGRERKALDNRCDVELRDCPSECADGTGDAGDRPDNLLRKNFGRQRDVQPAGVTEHNSCHDRERGGGAGHARHREAK